MSDEKIIQLEARIAAIEYFVAQMYRMKYEDMGATDEYIADSHAKIRKAFSTGKGIEGSSDPAMLDHISAEIANSVDGILEMIEDAVALYKRNSG